MRRLQYYSKRLEFRRDVVKKMEALKQRQASCRDKIIHNKAQWVAHGEAQCTDGIAVCGTLMVGAGMTVFTSWSQCATHATHGLLSSEQSLSQMTSWLVQPFLQSSQLWPTDRSWNVWFVATGCMIMAWLSVKSEVAHDLHIVQLMPVQLHHLVLH